jgi:hypothetical protein
MLVWLRLPPGVPLVARLFRWKPPTTPMRRKRIFKKPFVSPSGMTHRLQPREEHRPTQLVISSILVALQPVPRPRHILRPPTTSFLHKHRPVTVPIRISKKATTCLPRKVLLRRILGELRLRQQPRIRGELPLPRHITDTEHQQLVHCQPLPGLRPPLPDTVVTIRIPFRPRTELPHSILRQPSPTPPHQHSTVGRNKPTLRIRCKHRTKLLFNRHTKLLLPHRRGKSRLRLPRSRRTGKIRAFRRQ